MKRMNRKTTLAISAVSLALCAAGAAASDRATLCETVNECLAKKECIDSFSPADVRRLRNIAKSCPAPKKVPEKGPGPILDL